MKDLRSVQGAIAIGMIAGAALAAGAKDEPNPSVPDLFLLRPVFQTTHGEARAGTSFAVTLPGRPGAILLTALHLLGQAGGLKEDIATKDVPGALQGVIVHDCFDAKRPPIRLGADLATIDEDGDTVALFVPADIKLPTKPLAAKMPEAGARVWLAAESLAGAPKGRRLHPARSGWVQNGFFVYVLDDADLECRSAIGAPVLNAAGEVVAIHLAFGKTEEGKLTAIGNTVSRFRPLLETAAAQRPR